MDANRRLTAKERITRDFTGIPEKLERIEKNMEYFIGLAYKYPKIKDRVHMEPPKEEAAFPRCKTRLDHKCTVLKKDPIPKRNANNQKLMKIKEAMKKNYNYPVFTNKVVKKCVETTTKEMSDKVNTNTGEKYKNSDLREVKSNGKGVENQEPPKQISKNESCSEKKSLFSEKVSKIDEVLYKSKAKRIDGSKDKIDSKRGKNYSEQNISTQEFRNKKDLKMKEFHKNGEKKNENADKVNSNVEIVPEKTISFGEELLKLDEVLYKPKMKRIESVKSDENSRKSTKNIQAKTKVEKAKSSKDSSKLEVPIPSPEIRNKDAIEIKKVPRKGSNDHIPTEVKNTGKKVKNDESNKENSKILPEAMMSFGDALLKLDEVLYKPKVKRVKSRDEKVFSKKNQTETKERHMKSVPHKTKTSDEKKTGRYSSELEVSISLGAFRSEDFVENRGRNTHSAFTDGEKFEKEKTKRDKTNLNGVSKKRKTFEEVLLTIDNNVFEHKAKKIRLDSSK